MNSIQELVSLIGEDDAREILGIHYNTLYKWRADIAKPDQRTPNKIALNFASFVLYFIKEYKWSPEDLKAVVGDMYG